MTTPLSAADARRITLAAQGFSGRTATASSPSAARIAATVARLHVLQIDSVNVWERSHYMPVFSRLGPYDKARLDRLTDAPGAPLTEFWAHEATFLPWGDLPLFAFRRQSFRELYARKWPDFVTTAEPLAAWLEGELREHGPRRASEIEHDENRRAGPWWGWSRVKQTLEWMFRTGRVVAAPRDRFERRYALPDQVAPPEVLGRDMPGDDALRELVRRSASAIGVGTAADLADYFRLTTRDVTPIARELAEEGELVPVAVESWTRGTRPLEAWLHRDARVPRRLRADALLSPFDPVVWDRSRLLRQHGMDYRIEIYTPEAKRRFGYYSLPVLLGDRVSARVDLKNDRQRGVLRVQSAWREPWAPSDAPERIAAQLQAAAVWQGLESIEVADRGDLATALRAAIDASTSA